MKRMIEYFLKYPIWANVFMIGILLFGYTSMKGLRTSFFPEFDSNKISITVAYPGTSPEENEKSLVRPIEDALEGVSGIDTYMSISSENFVSINIRTKDKADVNTVLEDIKNAVDQITPWPPDAEAPRIAKVPFTIPAVVITMSGDYSLWTLKKISDEYKDDLIATGEVSDVTVTGYPKREISVELSEEKLREFGLTLSTIADVLKSENLDLTAGVITGSAEEITIRSLNKIATVNHIKRIVLKKNSDGTLIHVGDVASVVEKWSSTSNRTLYNGKKSITIIVNQAKGQDILKVAKATKALVDQFSNKYPNLDIAIPFDSTKNLKDRIDLLVKNGLFGLVLVVITLTFFMNIRIALWVALGIPVAFSGTFIVGSLAGITINMISLFAMILVVGILVDDAIVVAEQTFQGVEEGMSRFEAAKWGVTKVVPPVFTSVLTTVFAFLPFFFFEGMMGKMAWQMSLVVIAALMFSLFESFFILPAHLSHSKGLVAKSPNKIRSKVEVFYTHVTNNIYGKALQYAINHKLVIFMVPVAMLLMVVGMFRGGIIQYSPFPMIDNESITINVALAPGTRDSVTEVVLNRVKADVIAIGKKIEKEVGYKLFLSTRMTIGGNSLGDVGGHAGEISIELVSGEKRKISSMEITEKIRNMIGVYPEAEKFSFGDGGRWGKPISISLTGSNTDELEKAKKFLMQELSEYATVKDVVNLDAEGPKEIHIELTPKAYSLGFSRYDIVSQIRNAFYGVNVQTIQRGEDEIELWVSYSNSSKKSVLDLKKMHIKSRTGMQIPLSELVKFKTGRSLLSIKHVDGKKEIRIEADVSGQDISTATVLKEIKSETMSKITTKFPSVKWAFRGQSRDNGKFMDSVKKGFVPALIGILVILILTFRSWIQAVIIFFMIPLGVMGSLLGHVIMGKMLAMLSTMGIVALAGIVINDSIVFVDQINFNLRSGMKLHDAVYSAGLSRLRPILMTTITTVVGLMPLITEKSFQAQFLIPMAISVSFGLIFGSVFILFEVPVIFLIMNSARIKFAQLKRFMWKIIFDEELPEPTPENVEPAALEGIKFSGEES